MQSSFIYNDILVKDVCTEFIDYSSEKDSTGVDQIGIRGQCVFSGIVHAASKDHTGAKVNDFRGELTSVLGGLSKDRRKFVFMIGKKTIFAVGPGAVDCRTKAGQVPGNFFGDDISNGPHVSVQVVKITAGVSAHIRFTINFVVPECDCDSTGDGGLGGLINFRFWIHEGIDCKTYLTTRTYMGRIRVAHKNISPHALARITTIPELEAGFQRQIMQWDESSDGLHLDFTIRDQERIASAPWNRFAGVGAIEWDGQLTARTGNNFGFTGNIDFNLHLVGPKTTSKADLIRIGFLVANAKARLFEAASAILNPNAAIFLDSLAVTEELAENEIVITSSIRHTGNNVIDGILSVGADQLLGRPMGDLGIGYDSERHFTPGQSAGIGGLFLSVLQTPCNPARFPISPATGVRRAKVKRRNAIDLQEPSPGDLGSGAASAMSPSQLSNMYLEYLLDSEIIIKSGRIALPTGAPMRSTTPSVAVVNLHRQTAVRLINIDATRLNANPQFPAWSLKFRDSNGIIHVPIGDGVIHTQAPQISADNRKLIFRAQQHLEYALSRAPEYGESLPLGSVPYRVSSLNDPSRVFHAESFVQPSVLLS